MAKLNLAVLYLKGIGVTRDPKLGVDLLNQLAEKGDPRANAYLGILYLDGIGVPPDQALAEKYIEKAAKKKSPEGQYALGRLFSTVPQHAHDLQTALKWFRSAAAAGYVPAMSALGILLVHHPELKERKDPEEGVTLLQRAAEAGRWESSATLGDLARTGAAGHQNAREAFRWFTIAARQGGAIAEKETRAQLDYYRGVLPADQQDWELQQADAWLAQHPERDLYLLKDGFKILAGASRDLAE